AQQQAALPPPKAVAPPPAAPSAVAKLPAPPPAQPAVQPAPQPAKPAATPAVTGGSGSWRIQLASVRSEGEAASEWKRIAGRYPDALGGLSFQVAKVDLGEKGVFYRVQGAGADETRAKSICAQLRAQNTGCVVVRP
ncbi:SPOR domain-containing protein, partial [Azospirillum doebereinerae]|uniref:SPOR domain-containing protein n=1 Tax=Azospirillum doebereinerae TaxID=92933 RepID=UPI001EE56117